jgi:DNA polymerase V
MILNSFEVGDVWGIGRQYSKKLAQENILTAYDFKYANPLYIKKTLNINGLKTQNELKGVSCLPLEEVKNKKGICTSRSFGAKVTSLNSLQEAVSSFVTTASEKLRDQDSKCYEISVFIRTNFFSKQDLQYSNIASYKFLEPTSYSPDLIKASRKLLKSIYRPGYLYQKAGVYLSGIVNGDEIQESLFSLENFDFTKERKQSLMDCVDKLNKRFGNQKVTFASNNLGSKLSVKDPNSILNANKEWKTKSSSRSDRYTTNWEELLKINLK